MGGGHTYASIEPAEGESQPVHLTRILDAAGARRLNQWDACSTHQAGEPSERFESREAAIDGAKAWLEIHGRPGDRLLTTFAWLTDGEPTHVLGFPATT
jgi:hypothetical protein